MVLVKSGRVIDPENGTDDILDLIIGDGVIKKIGKIEDNGGFEEIIDAKGMIVAPGFVDIHAHFREPGFTHKEDIASGAKAAAGGGFTSVVIMANTKPVIDSAKTLRQVLSSAEKAVINVFPVAAVSKGLLGKKLTKMATLKELGAVGFSDDGAAITDPAFMRSAMLLAKDCGAVISLHEEDPALIGCSGVNDGAVGKALGFCGAPALSESGMVARDCMLALNTGARVHFQHISCERSVNIIRKAKSLGALVTAEVTPHHFSLTQDAVFKKGAYAKTNPPLRTERDRQSLIEGLRDGVIDIVATDHAPHSAGEKSLPFDKAPSGIIGLETALALGITNLVKPGYLTLPKLIEKMSAAPAKLYGLEAGAVAEGKKADIVIFKEDEEWLPDKFLSKSSNSPFTGERLRGRVKFTICGGNIVYRDGDNV